MKKRWWRWLFLLGLVADVAWISWGALSYAGPYRWLSELQLRVAGSFDPKVSVVVALFLTIVPPIVIGAVIAIRRSGSPLPPTSAANQAEAVAELRARVKASVPSSPLKLAGLAALSIVVLFAIIAAPSFFRWRSAGALTRYPLATLERDEPDTRFVATTGMLLPARSLSYKEREPNGSSTTVRFVPLVSSIDDTPLRIFVRYENWTPATGLQSISGITARNDIPGFILNAEQRRSLHIADDVLVIDSKATPERERIFAVCMVCVGLFFAALVFVFVFIRTRRSQRRQIRTEH